MMVLQHDDQVTHLSCEGVLTARNVGELDMAVEVAVDTKPAELHIDLTAVTYIGFVGVIALLRAARTCSEADVTFQFDPSPTVTDALDVAGLSWLADPDEIRTLDKAREVALRNQALDRLVRTPYLI
jgi:anti-anti-sigma factor